MSLFTSMDVEGQDQGWEGVQTQAGEAHPNFTDESRT